MKLRFLVAALIGSAFVGCQDQEPLSPGQPQQPVFSAAEATPFTVEYSGGIIDPGVWSYTGEVLHIRGLVGGGAMSGYMEGTVTVELDADLVAGGGPSRASATIVVTDLDGQAVTGTFEGKMRGRASGFPGPAWLHSGHIVAHGTGDLAGMKLWGDYTNEANPGVSDYVFTGRILDPHGG